MDKYIKYPLHIDKTQIDFNLGYMKDGGNQLIEIMEKAYPMEFLEANIETLKITNNQMKRLKSWLENYCNVQIVKREFNFKDSYSAKSFFYRGAGLLAKLYKILDLKPEIEDGEFKSKFSFIDYDIVDNEIGILVISKIIIEKFSHKPSEYESRFLKQTFFFKRINGEIIELDKNSQEAKELTDMYELTNIITK